MSNRMRGGVPRSRRQAGAVAVLLAADVAGVAIFWPWHGAGDALAVVVVIAAVLLIARHLWHGGTP